MRTGRFVSALWGDEHTQAHYGRRPVPGKAVLDAVAAAESRFGMAIDRAVFAFGKENLASLKRIGFKPTLLSEDRLPNCRSDAPRSPSKGYQVNWGVSQWRYKLEAMSAAMDGAGAVVWLDWDVHALQELPEDLWDRLANGPPIQAALRLLWHCQCGWRQTKSLLPHALDVMVDDWRWQHHGGLVYVRGQGTMRDLLTISDGHQDWGDEIVFGALVDKLMGGAWLGARAYHDMGFEPYCYDLRKDWIFPTVERIFLNTGN